MISLSTIERVARALAKANDEDADALVSEQRTLLVTRKGHSIVSGVVPLWHSYMGDAIAVCQEIDERPLEWEAPSVPSQPEEQVEVGGISPTSWWDNNGLYPPIDP